MDNSTQWLHTRKKNIRHGHHHHTNWKIMNWYEHNLTTVFWLHIRLNILIYFTANGCKWLILLYIIARFWTPYLPITTKTIITWLFVSALIIAPLFTIPWLSSVASLVAITNSWLFFSAIFPCLCKKARESKVIHIHRELESKVIHIHRELD